MTSISVRIILVPNTRMAKVRPTGCMMPKVLFHLPHGAPRGADASRGRVHHQIPTY